MSELREGPGQTAQTQVAAAGTGMVVAGSGVASVLGGGMLSGLVANDARALELRTEIAKLLCDIDAGSSMLIEASQRDLERHDKESGWLRQ
jgi:hypothetical protein